MNREILYRGKGAQGEGWQVGYYWQTNKTTYCIAGDYAAYPDNTEHYILFDRMTDWGLPNQKFKVDIDPDTLCEFTNKYDRNKARIFENDLVIVYAEGTDEDVLYQVVLEEGSYILKRKNGLSYSLFHYNSENMKVVGNVFDNSELLKELN